MNTGASCLAPISRLAVRLRRLVALGALALCFGGAAAQGFPSKPIRMIVPFPPGGATDACGRVLAAALTAQLKYPVVIENLAGANGGIGAEVVAKARPDGHTLLFTSMGTLVMNPHIYRKSRFSVENDLMPVAKVFDTPLVIEARPDRELKTLNDLIARARSAPGNLTYASGGSGASSHMAAELFKYHTKTDLTHIPYKGNGPALQDLLGGQVDVMFDQLASSLPHILSGRLRAIAVTAHDRLPSLPNVPTVAELGYPELEMSSWGSVTAPAGTPHEVVGILSRAILAVLQDPAVRERMERNGAVVASGDAQALGVLMKEETGRWGKIIRAAGISSD
jgi:tripartite-type tricarboxylate transporter receptor subunit TctC